MSKRNDKLRKYSYSDYIQYIMLIIKILDTPLHCLCPFNVNVFIAG